MLWFYTYVYWYKILISLWFPVPEEELNALRNCYNAHSIRLNRIEQELRKA